MGVHHPRRSHRHLQSGEGVVAHRGADSDAVLGRGRLGERPRRAAGRHGAHPVTRAADRADAGALSGALGNGARGDRLMASALLELAEVSKSFGGLRVIDGLDLVVNEREIVSVIGPNGAGKTTLFNLITGIYSPDAGEIRLDGENLVGMPPHKIARRGAARTFQTLRLFLNMSVIENVMASQY